MNVLVRFCLALVAMPFVVVVAFCALAAAVATAAWIFILMCALSLGLIALTMCVLAMPDKAVSSKVVNMTIHRGGKDGKPAA
jgi:hypothetical protein